MEEASGATEHSGVAGRTEKAYCCSNYPQTESTLIAKFDFVLEAIGLLSFIIAVSTVASKESPALVSQTSNTSDAPPTTPSTPTPMLSDSAAGDLSMFFEWPKASQLVVLSLCLVCCLIGIAFSILLWLGVKKKNHSYLLTWFIFNIVCHVAFSIIGVVAAIKATDRVMISVCTVTFFLYKWYCLWIVKLLMSEIRAVREGYTNPLDDAEIDHANNLVPSSDSFTVDKF